MANNKYLSDQGCGLGKITRSPKVPVYLIMGAQHLSLYEKKSFDFPVIQRQKLVALVEHSPVSPL